MVALLVSQHTTEHFGLPVIELVITHGTPGVVKEQFHATFFCVISANKSYLQRL